MTVPPTQPTYCTAVEPNSSQRSNVPSPRPAIAHEASTIACPWTARRSGPPGSDGPSATPIGRKREFTSAAASTAAATVPPWARIAIAVNWAEPANTIADIAIAAPADSPALCATTPKDSASSVPGDRERHARAHPVAQALPPFTGVRLVHHRQPARRRARPGMTIAGITHHRD